MTVTESVAILFTDLVGSTGLMVTAGPAAAGHIRHEHFDLLCTAIRRAGGREVKNLGDGMMAVFGSASSAVSCAGDIQRRVEHRNRRAKHPVSVRVGISFGETDTEGGDYFGTPVIEAARLCAAAAGGQTLVSGLVRSLATSRAGARFESVGLLRLKGLPEPVEAHEVRFESPPASDGVPLPPVLQRVPNVPYVGRATEVATLERLWHRACAGERGVAVVSGEPGIGKTRLAAHLAVTAHTEGGTVLLGRCSEDIALPFHPWVEALAHLVDHAPDDALTTHVQRYGGELVRLVPGLARRVPNLPAPVTTDPETERYLLLRAVVGLLEEFAARDPVVLILDDLQWADKPSLALVKHLVTSTGEVGLLVVAAYRHSELTRSHPLLDVLADLRRDERTERMALSGLDDGDVVSLVEAVAGHGMGEAGVALAREIRRETSGNPFFVGELLRNLRESRALVQRPDGQWVLDSAPGRLVLPQSVREVVARRVERLGEETARVLSVAAVIGREFDVAVLARAAGLADDRVVELLTAAAEAAVVVESSERAGRFSFAHALVNHTLYEELGPTRRARIHRSVAEAVEDVCGGEAVGARLGELARHWAAATTTVAPAKAIEYSRRAGEHAFAQLAPDESVRWFEQTLDLLTGHAVADPALRCDVLTHLGAARREVGDPRFRDTLLEASRLALEHRDYKRLLRAALANNRGRTSFYGRVDRDRLTMLETAVARTSRSSRSDRARLLSLLALELVFAGDYSRRRSLIDEALGLARRCGDAQTLGHVLSDRAYVIWAPGTLAEREANVAELLDLSSSVGDPVIQFWALYNDADVRMEKGDVSGGQRAILECRRLADELRQPSLLWAALVHEACLALAVGSLEEAEALAHQALAAGEKTGEPDALISFAAQWGLVLIEQGRFDESIPPGEKAARGFPGLPAFHAALAIQYLDEASRPDMAQRVLDEARGRRFADIPDTPITTTALALYGEAAARLHDRGAAAELYDLLAPRTEAVVWNGGVNTFNVMAYYQGATAAALGRYDEAEAKFKASIDLATRIGSARWRIRPRLHWAEMLQERRAEGDLERAHELLCLALEGSRTAGCRALAQRAERGLAALAAT